MGSFKVNVTKCGSASNHMVTFGVEERKQLSAQLSVGHRFLEEHLLLSQLLRAEDLGLACHALVVVQHGQQSCVRGPGKECAFIQVSEKPKGRNE